MEDNFRNVLIIISAVVIAAIFIHGLWTIRKQKNPYKLKTNKEKVETLPRDFDRAGFDQDGVGQVKVLKQKNEPEVSSEQDFEQPISLEEISHLEDGQSEQQYPELTTQEQIPAHEVNLDTLVQQDDEVEEITLEPVYLQPVTQAKPEVKKTKKPAAKKKIAKTKLAQAEIKRNQMEINFGDGIEVDDKPHESEPMQNVKAEKKSAKSSPQSTKKQLDIEPKIIVLSVVMPPNQYMSGAALLPSLLTLGMKYGEMDVFHRHQDNAGNGGVCFSLANMMNPGVFDLDTMETFATQGVSLFMTLPNAVDAFAAFEQMLAAAKQLAAEFNAQLLDDKRNMLTKQAEQHYLSEIREFERQYRLANAE
ncbi:MAG: cell division protein ZipA [Litorilituus sp.]|jgi:cell division protein ZipA|nr:cell division protein ZipA [Litorilituus sp.]